MSFTPEPTNPEWPINVMIFRPGDSVDEIKERIKPTEDELIEFNLYEGKFPENKPTEKTAWTYSSKKKHFTTQHYALLFAPGVYNDCSFEIGYYVQMAGLGKSPSDVQFTGAKSGPFVDALNKNLPVKEGGTIAGNNIGLCLDTFWRAAENFRAVNTRWAVSQAAPLRNVIVDNDLMFGEAEAYSSGGFLANAKVGHQTNFIANQQWFSRSVEFGGVGAAGGAWNTCFSGCKGNVPEPGVVIWQGKPSNSVRTIEPSPEVRIEKPFITMKDMNGTDYFELVVPHATWGEDAIGPMVDGSFEDVRSFSKVKVCKPFLPMTYDEEAKKMVYGEINDYTYNVLTEKDEKITEELQAALDEGKDLVLCPGIFFLTKTLVVRHPNQVILGLGLATLVAPQDGTPCIKVEPQVPGVRIAGLVLEASLQTVTVDETKKRCLLEVGNIADAGDPTNPVLLADIFCRVGGSNLVREKVETDVMIRIHSGNVVGDNLWLWRADHVRLRPNEVANDARFPFYHQVRVWKKDEEGNVVKKVNECYVENALEVNGDDVKMYGLFCEHTIGHQMVWRGERGTVSFFQCELPYDVNVDFAEEGYVGYYVDPNVKVHKGLGVGVYSNFTQFPVVAPLGLSVQGHGASDDIQIDNAFTVFLNGKGGIKNVIKVASGVLGDEVKDSPGSPNPDQIKRALTKE